MRPFLSLLHRHKYAAAILSISLSIAMFFAMRNMKIKADFLQLLPENFQSVRAMNHISNMMGGVGSLILVVESPDRKTNIAFLDRFYKEAAGSKYVKYIDYKRPLSFIKQNGILWLPKDMLEEMYHDLKRRLDYERQKRVLFLPEELGPPPPLNTTKILRELEHRTGKTPYYENKDGTLMISIIKPSRNSEDLGFVQELIDSMKGITRNIGQDLPKVQTSFTGLYIQKLEQIQAMQRDMGIAGLFTVVGITLILLLFFRSPKAILITIMPLVFGILWTLGLTGIIIGHVNIVSGFFLSILMGLGIDYSLQLFARYREEYMRDNDPVEALYESLRTTGKGTLFGALTTLGVFMILILSDFKAFHETGILSSVGILSIFLSIMWNMPLFIFFLKPRFTLFKLTAESKPSFFFQWKETILLRHPGKILIGGGLLIVLSFFTMTHNHYEYDMRKLENKDLPAVQTMEKLQKVFKADFAPAVALGYTLDELASLRDQINELQKDPENLIVDHRSILDYYPYPESNLTYRIFLVRKIRSMLYKNFSNLSAKDQRIIRPYLPYLNPQRVPLSKYPDNIRIAFIGNDNGKPGYFYYIYPPSDLGMGEKAFRFAETLKKIHVKDTSSIASDTILLSEILNLIKVDGEFLLPAVFIAILLLVFALFRSVRVTLLVLSPLVIGLIYLAGFIGLSNIISGDGITFNHLNVVMIPVLLGVGIDYGIHIYHRMHDEFSKTDDPRVALLRLYETSKALFISASTTVVGFMSLFLAGYRGLRGMAWLSVPGMILIFLTSAILLPALYIYLEKKHLIAEQENEK